jgi:hypothetical protein
MLSAPSPILDTLLSRLPSELLIELERFRAECPFRITITRNHEREAARSHPERIITILLTPYRGDPDLRSPFQFDVIGARTYVVSQNEWDAVGPEAVSWFVYGYITDRISDRLVMGPSDISYNKQAYPGYVLIEGSTYADGREIFDRARVPLCPGLIGALMEATAMTREELESERQARRGD